MKINTTESQFLPELSHFHSPHGLGLFLLACWAASSLVFWHLNAIYTNLFPSPTILRYVFTDARTATCYWQQLTSNQQQLAAAVWVNTLEVTQQTPRERPLRIWSMTNLPLLILQLQRKPYTYLPRTLKRLLMYTRSCKLTRSHSFLGSATYLSGTPSM